MREEKEERDFTESNQKLAEFASMISDGIVSYSIEDSDAESCVIVGSGEKIYYHLSKLLYIISRENDISPYELMVNLLMRVEIFKDIAKKKPHLFENINTEPFKE